MTDTIIAGPQTLNEAALSPSIIILAKRSRIKERDDKRGRSFHKLDYEVHTSLLPNATTTSTLLTENRHRSNPRLDVLTLQYAYCPHETIQIATHDTYALERACLNHLEINLNIFLKK